jgi:O-antigen/teichoic acid export membrane protein
VTAVIAAASRARRLVPPAWLDVLGTGSASVARIGASLLIVVITTRVLGPSGRGLFAAASSWMLLFGTFASLSIGPVIVNLAAGKPKGEWAPAIGGSALALTGVVTIGAWAIASGIYAATDGALFANLTPVTLAAAFLTIPFLIGDDNARYLLYCLDRLGRYNRAQVIGAISGPAWAAVFLLGFGWGVSGALLAVALSYAVTACVAWGSVIQAAGRVRPTWSTGAQLVSQGLKLHLNAIGNYLFTQASVIILSYYRAPAEVGYYQLAMQMFNLSLVLPTAFGAVAYRAVAQKGPDGAWPEQRGLLVQAVLAATVAAAAGYLLAPFGIRLLAGEAFLPAVPLFRVIALSLIGAAMSAVMASQWVGRGLLWQVSALTLGVGVLSLACDFILIPRYGARGAVVSTLVTYGLSVIGNGVMAAVIAWRLRGRRDPVQEAAGPS